ncbi:MAG: hypothetical protein ACPL3C_02050, partial [Pyrobaculum sp.]
QAELENIKRQIEELTAVKTKLESEIKARRLEYDKLKMEFVARMIREAAERELALRQKEIRLYRLEAKLQAQARSRGLSLEEEDVAKKT